MNSSETQMTNALTEACRRVGDAASAILNEGVTNEFVEVFDTCVRQPGPTAVIDWYQRNEGDDRFKDPLRLIDLFSYLSSAGIDPFSDVAFNCHSLLTPPPFWIESQNVWEYCAVRSAQRLDDMIDQNVTEAHVFNYLSTIAGILHEVMRKPTFAPPGYAISAMRAWVLCCKESDSIAAQATIRMCNLMDAWEIF